MGAKFMQVTAGKGSSSEQVGSNFPTTYYMMIA